MIKTKDAQKNMMGKRFEHADTLDASSFPDSCIRGLPLPPVSEMNPHNKPFPVASKTCPACYTCLNSIIFYPNRFRQAWNKGVCPTGTEIALL
jgi:hypothetical protein